MAVFATGHCFHYWWSYLLFAPECKGLTCMLDPLLYRWGVPPVVIRCVQRVVLQTWITTQGPAIVMVLYVGKCIGFVWNLCWGIGNFTQFPVLLTGILGHCSYELSLAHMCRCCCYNQVETSPIFSEHVRVNQWSPFFSGEVRFFLDINRWTSGGDFVNYVEPTTCFSLFLMSYLL